MESSTSFTLHWKVVCKVIFVGQLFFFLTNRCHFTIAAQLTLKSCTIVIFELLNVTMMINIIKIIT